jgi:hypothetical protein
MKQVCVHDAFLVIVGASHAFILGAPTLPGGMSKKVVRCVINVMKAAPRHL